MASYNDDFTTMQEDAIRRVREMQKRSQSYVAPEESPPQQPDSSNMHNPQPPHQSRPDLLSSLLGNGGKGSDKGGELFNIAGIAIDEEKALIGILIYILYKQGADVKLLLALGYLLL